jgi:hypothetical protein
MNERTEVLDGLVVVIAAAGPEDKGAELLGGRSSDCCLTGVEGAADKDTGGGVVARFVV